MSKTKANSRTPVVRAIEPVTAMGAERQPVTAESDPIAVGDLISLKYSAELCQVVKIEGAAIIAARILDFASGEVFTPEDRVAVHLHECEKIPSPVLPCNWQQMKTTQAPAYAAESITSDELQRIRWNFMQRSTRRSAIDRLDKRRKEEGPVPIDAKHRQHERLLKTIQLFERMYDVWFDLAHQDSTEDYSIAWLDLVGVAHVTTMLDQARKTLYDIFRSFSSAMGSADNGEQALFEANKADDSPPESPTAEAAYANVLKFVADVKKLQRRAHLYTQTYHACANESEIMQPFETVVQNAMGKVAAWFFTTLVQHGVSREELEGTELLAGTRHELPTKDRDHVALVNRPAGKSEAA